MCVYSNKYDLCRYQAGVVYLVMTRLQHSWGPGFNSRLLYFAPPFIFAYSMLFSLPRPSDHAISLHTLYTYPCTFHIISPTVYDTQWCNTVFHIYNQCQIENWDSANFEEKTNIFAPFMLLINWLSIKLSFFVMI